ncbi:hypothetical protein K523DRAFT_236315 [Schizophyllum commune Tattone D]|nr:hypothetical protein K523DRAFT_236315 [Schizophyllum commune Tattone D]
MGPPVSNGGGFANHGGVGGHSRSLSVPGEQFDALQGGPTNTDPSLGSIDAASFMQHGGVGGEPFSDIVLDDQMMAMWNSAPSAFDTHSWDVYLSAMASQPAPHHGV